MTPSQLKRLLKSKRWAKGNIRIIAESHALMTRRQAEVDRIFCNSNEIAPATPNWYACFGSHTSIGCDGCEHWIFCMNVSFPSGWSKGQNVFVGQIIILEES